MAMTMSDGAFALQVAAGATSPCRNRSSIDICKTEIRRVLRILVPSPASQCWWWEREYKSGIRRIFCKVWLERKKRATSFMLCHFPERHGAGPAGFATAWLWDQVAKPVSRVVGPNFDKGGLAYR